MKTLTATNQRVQFYLNFTSEKPSTEIKRERLAALSLSLEKRNIMLDELFPNKQRNVLDQILFITSTAGISKVGADKLAESCGVSVRTVTNAVKALKSTGEYIVGRLIKTTGGAGKYIFVDKKHVDFRQIMRVVFSISDHKFAQLNAEQFAEQEVKENVDTTDLDSENRSSNNNISFISKTCSINNIYIDYKSEKEAIKTAIDLEPSLSLDEQRQRLIKYSTNKYQVFLFDFLRDIPGLVNSVRENLYKLALAIGSDATPRHFHIAKNVIADLNMQLFKSTTVIKTSIRALFENLYHERLNTLETPATASQDATEVFTDKTYVPKWELFYNWLEEREQ